MLRFRFCLTTLREAAVPDVCYEYPLPSRNGLSQPNSSVQSPESTCDAAPGAFEFLVRVAVDEEKLSGDWAPFHTVTHAALSLKPGASGRLMLSGAS